MTLLLLLAVLVSILLRMGTHLTVSWATVMAGICIYLLVGLIFGAIFGLMAATRRRRPVRGRSAGDRR